MPRGRRIGGTIWYISTGREWVRGILILSICGLIFIAIKSNQKRFLCLIFVILLFTRIYSAKVRFARNLMPLLPFFSLFAAFFLSYWLDWWGKRGIMRTLFSLLNVWIRMARLSKGNGVMRVLLLSLYGTREKI